MEFFERKSLGERKRLRSGLDSFGVLIAEHLETADL